MNSRILLSLSFFVFGVSPLLAETDDVQQMLQRMYQAASMYSYQGTFVYTRNNAMHAMRIFHSASPSAIRERIVSMDGNGREVIRDNDVVTCYLPDRQSVVIEKSRPSTGQFPPQFPTQIDSLQAFYAFTVIAACREEVANRATSKIIITPRDEFRYGYRLWIDKETGVLLKTKLLGVGERAVEQFMYTTIEYMPSLPEALLAPSVDSSQFTWVRRDENAEVRPEPKVNWLFGDLPPGFKMGSHTELHPAADGSVVEHLLLSDGLASISIFIVKLSGSGDDLMGGSRMGAVNAYGRVINGYHITAVGEVPQAAVRMVAESVQISSE